MGRVTEFRGLLEAGDVDALMGAHAKLFPHLPAPVDRAAAEVTMHMTRTQVPYVRLKFRLYSHSWLTERGLPSQLPDQLKPIAERLYPVIRSAVGIAMRIKERTPFEREASLTIRRAMEAAIEDCYANGDTDPATLTRQMNEARARAERQIYA